VAARKSAAEGVTPGDELIAKRFAPLRRHPCWGVSYDRQLNLSMHFGRPSLHIEEPFVSRSKSPTAQRRASRRLVVVRGQWWLWLFCCHWQLKQNDRTLATDSASMRQIELGLKELDGQKLVSLSVNGKSGFTRFEFDLGCKLLCRRFATHLDSDVWTLYGPGEKVLSVTGRGTVCLETSTGRRSRAGSSTE
jgi:hypothetical protein